MKFIRSNLDPVFIRSNLDSVGYPYKKVILFIMAIWANWACKSMSPVWSHSLSSLLSSIFMWEGFSDEFKTYINLNVIEDWICYFMFAFCEKNRLKGKVSSNNKEVGQLFNKMTSNMFSIYFWETTARVIKKVIKFVYKII